MPSRVALFLLTLVMVVGLLVPRGTALAAAAGRTVRTAQAATASHPASVGVAGDLDKGSGREAFGDRDASSTEEELSSTGEESSPSGEESPSAGDDESEENDGNEQDEPYSVPVLPVTPKPSRLGWIPASKLMVAELYLPPPGSPPETSAARG